MDVRVALACQEGEAQQAYINAIQSLGVHVDSAPSFGDLHRLLCENAYNGVMVDLKTKVKASQSEKDLVQNLLEQFPMAQLKFEEETGTVHSLNFGRARDSETVEAFINEECRPFPARPIRASVRKDIHLNALIAKTGGDLSEERGTRTVTMNISQGGCFLYSTDHWEIGAKVSIILKGLEDQRSITGEVRWQIPWGQNMQVPGIGVKFEGITPGQLAEIRDMCTS